MSIEDIKLGAKVDHLFGIGTIVAFKEEDKHHTVLIRFDTKKYSNIFLHSGINFGANYEGLSHYSYIELEKMNNNCFWINPYDHPIVKETVYIEDD